MCWSRSGGIEITNQADSDDRARGLSRIGQRIRRSRLLLDPLLADLDSAVRCAGAVVDDEMVRQVLASLELIRLGDGLSVAGGGTGLIY